MACDIPDANILTVGIMAVLAQHERELIGERTRAALKAKKAKDFQLGTPNLTLSISALGRQVHQHNARTHPAKVRIDHIYKPELWNFEIKENYVRLFYDLTSNDMYNYGYSNWRFSVYFYKDVISFSGPFNHFSSWYSICRDENLKQGWLSVIKSVYSYLQADKVIFFTEWGFDFEGSESFLELENYASKHPKLIASASDLKELENNEKLYIVMCS